MIVSNLCTSCTMSKFYDVVNAINNFFDQPMSVKYDSGIAWTTNSIDCFNPTTINVMIPSSSTTTYSPEWYCAGFCKYISSIIKIQSQKRSLFLAVFLTRLICQHHLVEFCSEMTNMTSEIFQKITCTLGVMYNVNLRHIESLMHMVVSLAVYKSFFKFIQEFIVVAGGGVSYIHWEVF